jgi:hypothetical protein
LILERDYLWLLYLVIGYVKCIANNITKLFHISEEMNKMVLIVPGGAAECLPIRI